MGTSWGMWLALALIVLMAVATHIVRSMKERKLAALLGEGRFKEFFLESEGALCRMTIPSFNLAYLRLNGFIMQGDDDRACESLEALLAARCSKGQRAELVMKAFKFYIEHGDLDRARSLFDETQRAGDESTQAEARLLKDVFIDKGFSHIDELLEVEASSPEGSPARFNACYLLAAQYANKGDKKRASEYERRAERALLG